MDQFISIVVFSIPGLLVYFWIQSFGMNPVVKHSPTELVAIATLFWIPTVLLSIITYDIIYLVVEVISELINIDILANLNFITNLSDIQNHATNIIFIIYFFISSIYFSYKVAVYWAFKSDKVLAIVNKVRLKRKLSSLSDASTVWDAFFIKLDDEKETPLVAEVYKIDKQSEKIVGSITKMSRPHEADRSIVLEEVPNNTSSHEHFKYEIKRTYIDIKSGLVVSELDITKPTDNKDDFPIS
jgi:hypothetical protein